MTGVQTCALPISNQLQTSARIREPQAFRKLVSSIPLDSRPGLRVLGWIPRVKVAQRNTFESQTQGKITTFVRSESYTTDLSKQASLQAAPTKDEYYPFQLEEPASSNSYPLSFDAGSEPVLWSAMQRAAKSGKLALTGRLPLPGEEGGDSDIMVFLPVFAKGSPHGKGDLLGFAFGLIDPKLIDIEAMRDKRPHEITVRVFDTTDPDRHQIIYKRVHAMNAHSGSAPVSPVKPFRVSLKVADRQWTFVGSPVDGKFLSNRLPERIVLISGVSFTLLLSLYIFTLIQRNLKSKIGRASCRERV